MSDFVPWLRELAAAGGKGVVNNVDARSLGRIADEIERLRAALKEIEQRNLNPRVNMRPPIKVGQEERNATE